MGSASNSRLRGQFDEVFTAIQRARFALAYRLSSLSHVRLHIEQNSSHPTDVTPERNATMRSNKGEGLPLL